jgi:hypothetical protein
MSWKWVFLILFTWQNCKKSEKIVPTIITSQQPKIEKRISFNNYPKTLQNIAQLRKNNSQKQLNDSTKSNWFTECLVDSIFPYWYGTTWDFNGNTTVPNEGSIACGFFVSTVLQQIGFTNSRVKLGQASSNVIIAALASKNDIKLFLNKTPEMVYNYFFSKGKGIYIIGLDCHVGFVHFDGKQAWFIHSKWYREKCVVKENFLHSYIIRKSSYKLLGKISSNKIKLDNWIK